MKDLTKLFDKHWSDKGFNRDEGHGYGEIYDDIFRKYIGKHPKILEIGIQRGGCIRAISEFFNGECDLYGIDIDNNCKSVENDVKCFKFFNFNASDKTSVENFKENNLNGIKFDIIIDDGSHICSEQLKSLAFLHDCLNDDGIYIIEDLHCCLKSWNPSNRWTGNSKVTTIDCLIARIPHDGLSKEENDLWVTDLDEVLIHSQYNKKINGKSSVVSILKYKKQH